MSACVHGSAVRCWSCMTGCCYEAPTLHPWWGESDTAHARDTGQPAPSGWCGCAFCGEPAVKREGNGGGKAQRLVINGRRVLLARGGGGDERGRGVVVGYYDHPTYLVQLDNGERVAWSERLVFELDDGGAVPS